LSEANRDRLAEVSDELSPQDRAWLTENLDTYAELLTYLHDR
jgi:hypothetical protein